MGTTAEAKAQPKHQAGSVRVVINLKTMPKARCTSHDAVKEQALLCWQISIAVLFWTGNCCGWHLSLSALGGAHAPAATAV